MKKYTVAYTHVHPCPPWNHRAPPPPPHTLQIPIEPLIKCNVKAQLAWASEMAYSKGLASKIVVSFLWIDSRECGLGEAWYTRSLMLAPLSQSTRDEQSSDWKANTALAQRKWHWVRCRGHHWSLSITGPAQGLSWSPYEVCTDWKPMGTTVCTE